MFLLLITFLGAEAAIVGYDCERLKDIRMIDATSVAECPPAEFVSPPDTIVGTVAQREDVVRVRVTRCSVTYLQSMFHCGMHSHSSAPLNTVITGSETVGREACMSAAATGMLPLFRRANGFTLTVDRIRLNQTRHFAAVIVGAKDNTGACDGDTYVLDATTYTEVVVERDYKIVVSQFQAEYDTKTNTVVMPSGLACPYGDLSCSDGEFGDHFWSALPPTDCSNANFKSIYFGRIDVVEQTTITGELAKFAIVTSAFHVFALRLMHNITECGLEMTQTEHPKLFVHFGPTSPFKISDSVSTDMVPYINSKFLYSELRTVRNYNNISADVVYRRCLASRASLLSNLRLVRDQPELISHIFQTPGTIGRAVGEVIYVGKCTPVSLRLRRDDQCYDALPVSDAENRTLFVLPTTHIIVPTAEPVPCDGPFTPVFQVDGQWLRFTPHPVAVAAPDQLQPTSTPVHRLTVISQMGTAGLYTQDEMRHFSRLLSVSVVRAAITNTVSRAAVGDNLGGGDSFLPRIFTPEQAAQIVRNGFSRIWGWFGAIGEFISSVIGIVFVLKVIQFVLKTLFNGLSIARVTGCSVGLLAAFWTSATNFLIQHKTAKAAEAPAKPPAVIEERRPLKGCDDEEKDLVPGAPVNGCPAQ